MSGGVPPPNITIMVSAKSSRATLVNLMVTPGCWASNALMVASHHTELLWSSVCQE